jgi:Leucine-rich repeat (LRR) protein
VYFAAFPEDAVIRCEEVIDVWIAEGLVKSSGDSYLPDTGHSFIDFLRDRCLIEVVKTDDVGRILSVKIHDVLRDLVIRIAEKEQRCYFKAGQGVSLFPFEEVDSEGIRKLSLMGNNLQSLPTSCAFSSLSVLLLRGNRGIKEVPESFLRELSSLRVLDLSWTGIASLPPSVLNLKHLACLQLVGTGICELPETIGDLKELQVLNVRGCQKLRCLPERISELKRLRALDLNLCKMLSHLPRGISELFTLERLSMWDNGVQLDFKENTDAERKYGCLKDLQRLRCLRLLVVRIKSPVKEGVMGNWSKMRNLFLECPGANQDYLPQDMQAMKDLESFCLYGCDVERLPSWVTEFQKLAYLQLNSCPRLKELPAEFPCLRALSIEGCEKLEELELGMGFPKLERLILAYLESLECVGAVAAASGSGGLGEGASPLPPMLKSLRVMRCPKLKRLRGDGIS